MFSTKFHKIGKGMLRNFLRPLISTASKTANGRLASAKMSSTAKAIIFYKYPKATEEDVGYKRSCNEKVVFSSREIVITQEESITLDKESLKPLHCEKQITVQDAKEKEIAEMSVSMQPEKTVVSLFLTKNNTRSQYSLKEMISQNQAEEIQSFLKANGKTENNKVEIVGLFSAALKGKSTEAFLLEKGHRVVTPGRYQC